MPHWSVFVGGVAGAFVVYIVMYRETRVLEFAKDPRSKWPMFFVDVVVFLVAGGLVAYFTLNDPSPGQTFAVGAGWQGIAGGFNNNKETSTLRDQLTHVNSQLESTVKTLDRWRERVAVSTGDEEDVQEAPED